MKNYFATRPEYYALVAAALNGTIGPLNKIGFSQGGSPNEIAFFKCFLAFLVLLALCLFNPEKRRALGSLRSQWKEFAVLAFLGVFCLYFFETWAFSEAGIPLVSFLTYAAGGITLILSGIFLKERSGIYKITSFIVIILGVYLIFAYEAVVTGSLLGVALALIGGLGYALFIFMSKLFRVGSSLSHLVWLFGFGSLYLSVPFVTEGISLPSPAVLSVIVVLVLVPTIGGFYFTTKAVDNGEAGRVQIIETSDPMFASLFAYLLFGELMSVTGYMGAACIMAGLILAIRREGPMAQRSGPPSYAKSQDKVLTAAKR